VKSVLASFIVALSLVILPSGANAVGAGKACAGFVGAVCDAGLFCERPAGSCSPLVGGTCVVVPRFCPHNTGPKLQVCGCDGQTYGNDCKRRRAKVSANYQGACK
jgi:hypothetical protein